MEFSSLVLLQSKTPIVGVQPYSAPENNNELYRGIVTQKQHGVQVYDAFDRKSLKSWTVSSSIVFSSPVQQHKKQHTFIATREKKTVCFWHESDDNLNRMSSKTFNHNVQAIYPFSSSSQGVVVLESGDIYLCNFMDTFEIKIVSSHTEKKKKTITWSHFIEADKTREGAYLLLASPKESKLFVYEITSAVTFAAAHNLPSTDEEIISYSFDKTTGIFSFVSSSGNWKTMDFGSIKQLAEPEAKYEVINNLKFKNLNIPSIVLAPHGNFIILVAKKAEHSDPSYCASIFVWDVRYKVLIASYDLCSTDHKDHPYLSSNNGGKIVSVAHTQDNNHFFIALDHIIFFCSLYIPSSSLALAIGKTNQTLDFVQSNEHELTAPVTVQFSLDSVFQTASRTHEKPNVTVAQDVLVSMDSLFDTVQQANAKEEAALIELLKQNNEEKVLNELKTLIKRHRDTIYGRGKHLVNKVEISFQFLSQVMPRCLELKFFKAVGALVSTGLVSAETYPQLLPSVLSNKKVELLYFCLNKLSDISEKDLVSILAFFLKPENEKHILTHLHQHFKNTSEYLAFAEQVKLKTLFYVNSVMMRGYSKLFLQYHLKTLGVTETIVLLKYFLELLQHPGVSAQQKEEWRIPEQAVVIRWVNSLLDSHFTELILLPENRELLIQLRKTVQQQVTYCEAFYDIISHIRVIHAVEKNEAKREKPKTDYSIEVLYI